MPRGWSEAVPVGLTSHHCEERLVSGAFPLPAARPLGRAARTCYPCVPGSGGAGLGAQHRPHGLHSCEPALRAVGLEGGIPGGACHAPFRGAFEVRRSSSPGCPSSGRAIGVRSPRAAGTGVRAWGPGTVPFACMPC